MLQALPASLVVVVDADTDRSRRLLDAAGGVESLTGRDRLLQLRRPFGAGELQAAHDLGSMVDLQLVGSIFGLLQLPASTTGRQTIAALHCCTAAAAVLPQCAPNGPPPCHALLPPCASAHILRGGRRGARALRNRAGQVPLSAATCRHSRHWAASNRLCRPRRSSLTPLPLAALSPFSACSGRRPPRFSTSGPPLTGAPSDCRHYRCCRCCRCCHGGPQPTWCSLQRSRGVGLQSQKLTARLHCPGTPGSGCSPGSSRPGPRKCCSRRPGSAGWPMAALPLA